MTFTDYIIARTLVSLWAENIIISSLFEHKQGQSSA